MPAPQGETLSLIVDGQEMVVQLEPRILSRKAQERLSRLVRKQVRDNVWQDLEDLRSSEISEETKEELKAEYRQILQKVPGIEEIYGALTTADGVAAILEVISNLTYEDAKRAVADPENFVKLATAIGDIANRESEAVKN